MSDLQKKLKQMKGLLPSQQQWLERLIFQLEFNPYQLIHLVGGPWQWQNYPDCWRLLIYSPASLIWHY